MSKEKLNLEPLAKAIMFGGQANLANHGVQYRTGKTVEDVRKALRRANTPAVGMTSTQAELSMFELYLHGIFKAAKPTAAAPQAAMACAQGDA